VMVVIMVMVVMVMMVIVVVVMVVILGDNHRPFVDDGIRRRPLVLRP